jgi:uncharacterized protein (DUF1778 family)
MEVDMAIVKEASFRTARLGLRATPRQQAVLRRAADVTNKSLTDFILESACQAAEQALLDQRLFLVPGERHQALLDLLDRPAAVNPGLKALFARPRPAALAASDARPRRGKAR